MQAALVTGASKGIGKATARRLKKDGFFVYLHGRNRNELEELERELGQTDSVLVADFAKPADLKPMTEDLLNRLRKRNHRLGVLINNAGIYIPNKPENPQDGVWESQMQVNLLSPARLTELLIPILKNAAPSSIVNVSSTLGLKSAAGVSAYSASKAAMVSWSQNLALELGPLGIRVNCVCPGIVDTPIHGFHHRAPEEKMQAKAGMAGLQPLGRIGEPEDIAESIAFLAGPASGWTTGAVLAVDGGINLT